MITITSIAPGHKNFENQFKAVESWKKAGYEVVSLNAPEEIEQLKEFKGVKFISTHRHNKQMFGKPYVTISAIIDYLKEAKSKHSLIINSDIIINDADGITEDLKKRSEEGIIVMNRVDFDKVFEDGKIYELGFDGFYINEKHLETFPQSILCLGQCHWDYWLPYTATVKGVKLIRLKEKYIFHKKHNVQYSANDWVRTAEIFRSETGLLKYKNIKQATSIAYQTFKRSLA